MTASDICVVSITYAVCALFIVMTLELKAAAQIYPLCLAGALAALNTLYLAKQLWTEIRLKKNLLFINDLKNIFAGFQWRQFFFVLTSCVAYLALLQWLGFYLSSFIYLAGVMAWLRVKPLQLCFCLIAINLLVYAVFSLFLKVPLPKGIIFS